MILRFAIHEYLAGYEFLKLFSVSDPRVVCPRTCRRPDLFVPRECSGTSSDPQRYCEPHRSYGHPYTDRCHWTSWAHASQSHLPKSYRGSLLLYCYFQCPHMHHLKPQDWVKQSIPFSYLGFTANSLDGAPHAVQVYSDVSGGTSHRSSEPVVSLQLRFRVELGKSNEDDFVEPVVHCRCRLPQCHTPGTGSVH
jgi:hypothetical protein